MFVATELNYKLLLLALLIVVATHLNTMNFETLTVPTEAMTPLLKHVLLSFVDFETKPKSKSKKKFFLILKKS